MAITKIMKNMKTLLATLAIAGLSLILFNSFTGKALFQNSLSKQLIGEWRNVYVKINIITAKTGKTATMEADSSNWETRLGIKPIRTHFKGDDTYYSEYRSLKDSIIKMVSGTWSIKNDTLTMVQLKPNSSVLKLHISIQHDHATYHGMIDFDGSGKLDDEYFGVQKRFGDN
jgi:hypothetical protein